MTKPKRFKDMLNHPDSMLEGSTNIPSQILRELLAKLAMTPLEWETKMDSFFKDLHGDDLKKIREEKSNLTGALEKDEISWNRFEQALCVLGPNRCRFNVTLEYNDEYEVDATSVIRTRTKRRLLRRTD